MNSNLQNKLQQFNADPPERVWNKIADALDTETSFPQRLLQYEEVPPTLTWQTIEQSLNEESGEVKVIPFTTRFRTPLRYAAAACFIAVVLITITLSVKRTEAGAIQAESRITVPGKETTAAIPDTKETLPSSAQTSGSGEESTKNEESSTRSVSSSTNSNRKDNTIAAGKQKSNSTTRASSTNISSLGDFMMFSDGNGHVMKISKKLASLVNCKDGDESCRQRLQKLRQKMAAEAMTTDFTGILEMLRQLQ